MAKFDRRRGFAVLFATLFCPSMAYAADPRAPRPSLYARPPVTEVEVLPAPVVVGPPVPAIVLAPDYRDPRTRRCQPGYAENQLRICVRFDEPRIACGPTRYAPKACFVVPPNPAPYGLGAALRPNY